MWWETSSAAPRTSTACALLLDDGRLTDGQGRTVDFKQTLVLMTSNLREGSQLRDFFRPEFINRLDEVLTYNALQPDQIRGIVDVQLARLQKHLREQEIELELTGAAKEALAKEGYDPEYGARPLKRVIQKRIQNLLADAILSGKLESGSRASIDWRAGAFQLSSKKNEPEPASA